MRTFLLALLCCAPLGAQSLSFLIDNTNGVAPSSGLPALSSPYQFPATPVGDASSITIRVVNTSAAAVIAGPISVNTAPPNPIANPNFTLTFQGATIAPQAWKLFTLNFAPVAQGPTTGYLQAVAGSTVINVATLQGTGTAPGVVLTCNNSIAPQCNGSSIQANSATPLNFGNVSTTATSTITFTLANDSAAALNAKSLVSLSTQVYNTTPFALDTSTLPSTLAPNSSGNFTVTFAPGVAGILFQATLVVGSNNYLLTGTGTSSVSGDISSLIISYVDQKLVRLTAQPATAIAFSTPTLTFTVSNPQTTINAVTVPNLTVSGTGFALSGAPSIPATIQPSQSITFQIAFSASLQGTYNGTLLIGTRQFSLTAIAPAPIGSAGSSLPGISLICGASACSGQTFTSQQQVHAGLQLTSPAPTSSIVQLAMTFSPSVSGVTDDPAVTFISPLNARNLPSITFAQGSETGTYAPGQSQFTFQTGTTAGTITFTLTYLEQTVTIGTISIPMSTVQIASTTAVRQSPNLVVTMNGYDNTYSVGQLSFTFYDTSGKTIATLPVNATSNFHQYFFGPEDLGGMFSLQASFPVNGDVTQIGSVAITLTNAVGSTTTNQTFQ